MLTRDTDWRQGDLLAQESAAWLTALSGAVGEKHRVVVITHDCDLPHDAETSVEVIVGDVVNAANPQFSHARNPRKLHLGYEIAGGQPIVVELRHGERRAVPKGERLIGRIVEPEATHLVGLFFDLGEQRWEEVSAGEPYVLRISVVYDATEGGAQARQATEKVASQLSELFERTYGRPEAATEIALEACEAVADTSITLADLRRVDQWRLEYISLGDDEHGDFLPVGEMPV